MAATPAPPSSNALMGALGSVLGIFSGTWAWAVWIYQLLWGVVPTKKTWLIALISIGGTYAIMAYGDAMLMHGMAMKQRLAEGFHLVPPAKPAPRVAASKVTQVSAIPEARLAAMESRISTLEAEIAALPKRGRAKQ